MAGSPQRSRVHQVVLETAGPTESLVLGAIAKHHECGVEHLPAALVADVRAALMAGLRPVFAELDRLATLPAPIADALEPEPVSPSKRPTAPPPAGWGADEITPLEEPGYELTGDIRRLLDPRPTGRTLSSHPPPPPPVRDPRPTVKLPPPIPPDVLSKRLQRDPKKGGRY